MKTYAHAPDRRAAFSLTELITSLAVFSLVSIAVVYSHIMGLKMYNITATKLSASSAARMAVSRIRDEMRAGHGFDVGTGTASTFTNLPSSTPRQGNALQIYPFAQNKTNFIRYFRDAGDNKIKRVVSGNNRVEVIAPYVNNPLVFFAEDYAGNILTNDNNNRIIRVTMQFYQWEFPVATVGAFYDYYRLDTRITKRARD